MENEEDPVKKQQIVDARARNISHNVRCLECGSQTIEESQVDIVVLLRKLEDVYGETILCAPKLDWQTAALWLSPVSNQFNLFL
ncbi:hypothetical protein Hdeb2414_s0006g00201191 [Helianthus debilis subsp. tardiflorus]|nr:hypothetical protein HanLR1_Chr00c0078g0706361 [Helianthus annuus]